MLERGRLIPLTRCEKNSYIARAETELVLNLARIRLFHELARLGTISAAAHALGLTRPAVSQQLALLEREVGAVLFERSAGGLRLTTKGQHFLDRIQPLLTIVNEIEAELSESEASPTGDFRLSAFGSVATTIVPRAIGYLLKSHPHVDVVFSELEPLEGLKAFGSKQVDLAIVDDMVEISSFSQTLEFHPLHTDKLSVVLSADHRFATAGMSEVRLLDLAGEKWAINQTAVAYQSNLVNACLAAGFEMKVGCSTRNIAGTLEMVRTGRFVTVLPRLALEFILSDHDFIIIPLVPTIHRKIFAVIQKGTSRRPLISAALVALKHAARSIQI